MEICRNDETKQTVEAKTKGKIVWQIQNEQIARKNSAYVYILYRNDGIKGEGERERAIVFPMCNVYSTQLKNE